MRILVVSHEFPPIGGGGANACYYLTRGFCSQGHEVTVITANYQGLPEREIAEGVEIIRVSSRRKNREYCDFAEMLSYLLKAWSVAERMVKKKHYDICQVFFGIPSGPIGYLLKKKYHIPYIIRFGGGDIPGFQARFDKLYKLIAPLIRQIWQNGDRLVANSEGLRQLAYRFYDKKEIMVITNGVDTSYYLPKGNIEADYCDCTWQYSSKDTNKKNKIYLLFVSRLLERKGLQSLLPQMRHIIQGCSAEIHLTVVGDGPYRDTLEQMVKEEGIEEYVSFDGYKDRKQIVEYYQNADIFVLPSKKEGMPNVVLEAMACALPIVMTSCEGSEELIQGNGVVVGQNQFSQEIIRISNDWELRRKMSNESRRMALEQFGWEKKVNLYLKMYSEIVY